MNPYISKKMLLFLPLLLFILAASVIHNTLLSNNLDERLKKLHASGIYIEMLDEKNDFFVTTKNFTIRLDKVELIAELLFGIHNTDPLLVHLSKLQGLKLHIELKHTKFIFSNEFSMYISMENLPKYFTNQSVLFNEVLAFSQKHPRMLETTFNVWDQSFNFNIPQMKHSFNAENNISYDVDFKNLSLEGYIHNYADFDITNQCEAFSVVLNESNQTKATLVLNENLFRVIYLDENLDSTMNVNTLHLNFNMDKNISLDIHGFKASQSFIRDETSDISSKLSLAELSLKDSSEFFALKDLDYDVEFNHLNTQTVKAIKELINTSNIHTVAFIFDDLSDNIASLIQHEAHIKLNNFSFSDLFIKETHYNDAKLSLQASSQPNNKHLPIDLDINLHLSKALYQSFLDNVPNASLTLEYLKDRNGPVNFHLALTKEGLLLNDHNLLIEPEPLDDENSSLDEDNASLDEDTMTEDSITEETMTEDTQS